MSEASAVAVQAFRELKAANRALLVAMAREKRTRIVYDQAVVDLRDAKRRVKLLLDVVQPELPAVGTLDQEQRTTLGEVGSTLSALPEREL
jgi:hypothetical protein